MAENNTYGRIIIHGILFLGKIAHIHIHLPNILMPDSIFL